MLNLQRTLQKIQFVLWKDVQNPIAKVNFNIHYTNNTIDANFYLVSLVYLSGKKVYPVHSYLPCIFKITAFFLFL